MAAPEVKARGYWELVWIRFRRDRWALVSIGFIVFLFFAAIFGAPIARELLGHGPDDLFTEGVDADTFLPVGPMTRISEAPARRRRDDLHPRRRQPARPRPVPAAPLRRSHLARGRGARRRSSRSRSASLMGLLAGYFRGWIDTVVSRLTELIMVFPGLLFIIAVRVDGRRAARTRSRSGSSRRACSR